MWPPVDAGGPRPSADMDPFPSLRDANEMKAGKQRCYHEFDVVGALQKLVQLTDSDHCHAILVSLWSSVFELLYDEYHSMITLSELGIP